MTTNLAEELTSAAIVVVDEMMGSITERTSDIFRDGFAASVLNRFERFTIFPDVILKKELPVLFFKSFNDRKLIDFELLIFLGARIIEIPMLQRKISADKLE